MTIVSAILTKMNCMNDEQSTPGNTSEDNKGLDNPGKGADDYYSVDDPKKSVSTTIGDGEMHNEGLVGDGSVPDDDGIFSEGSTNEQDEAENHDSEG
jgi:hypothetical protein